MNWQPGDIDRQSCSLTPVAERVCLAAFDATIGHVPSAIQPKAFKDARGSGSPVLSGNRNSRVQWTQQRRDGSTANPVGVSGWC